MKNVILSIISLSFFVVSFIIGILIRRNAHVQIHIWTPMRELCHHLSMGKCLF